MKPKQITILGVGNLLFTDEGVGVRVAEALQDRYEFPENVKVVDGGTLGMNLLSIISEEKISHPENCDLFRFHLTAFF